MVLLTPGRERRYVSGRIILIWDSYSGYCSRSLTSEIGLSPTTRYSHHIITSSQMTQLYQTTNSSIKPETRHSNNPIPLPVHHTPKSIHSPSYQCLSMYAVVVKQSNKEAPINPTKKNIKTSLKRESWYTDQKEVRQEQALPNKKRKKILVQRETRVERESKKKNARFLCRNKKEEWTQAWG